MDDKLCDILMLVCSVAAFMATLSAAWLCVNIQTPKVSCVAGKPAAFNEKPLV